MIIAQVCHRGQKQKCCVYNFVQYNMLICCSRNISSYCHSWIQCRAVRYGQKIYITIILIFFDFDFNHDFDTNRHALSYTSCFCTSYLFLHILLVLHILFCTFLYSITDFTLYFFFLPIYIYICSCVVLLLYNLYSLHCPLSGPDLIYISVLIIPCIIYHVTNKETLTFTVINAFCVNLKHISQGNQLVVTCL